MFKKYQADKNASASYPEKYLEDNIQKAEKQRYVSGRLCLRRGKMRGCKINLLIRKSSKIHDSN